MAMVGKPPKDVVDRKEEIGRIMDSMTDPKSNANYSLIGHRGMGKSTIMLEVKRRLERRGIIASYTDFGEFRHSPVDFAESLTKDLTSSYSKALKSSRIRNSVKAALTQIDRIKNLRARFVASIDGAGNPRVDVDPYTKDRNENHTKALKDAFEYANSLSKKSKKRSHHD